MTNIGKPSDFHDRFVHADCGREHAGADVWNVGEFEKTLDRAILAVRSVQHREDHIKVQSRDHRMTFVVA